MGELRALAVGLVVVAVDLRFEGIDVLTDAVGWIMALVALASLAKLHGGFLAAGLAALVGLVAWAGDPWLGIDRGWADVADYVAQTVIVFATCTALMALVPARRATADMLRWWDLGLSVFVAALTAALDGRQDVSPLVLILIVPVFVVYIRYLVLLFRCADERPVTASP